MPKTVVKCSMPGCTQVANSKVAAPWQDGRNAELKTYGYACSSHSETLKAYAEERPRPRHLSPTETIGTIRTYPLQ